MEVLVAHGHPVECRDERGWPPLLYAHFQNHQECVLALMRAKPKQVRRQPTPLPSDTQRVVRRGAGWGFADS